MRSRPNEPRESGRDPEGGEYVVVAVAEQWLGIPIGRAHDVFVVTGLTRVPLAPPEVAGLVNLRGRVITALDLRVAFGLPPLSPAPAKRVVVGVERGPESFGLIVDSVGEVLRLGPDTAGDIPAHLTGRWAELSRGVHRLPDRLLLVLDVDAVLLSPERVPLAA